MFTLLLGKFHLEKEIDGNNRGVLKHLGQIGDSMEEWEGPISDGLELTRADIRSIHTKHPNNLRLQS